jgi:hypothetical protein
MRTFRYPPRVLLGDYLRAAAGLFVGFGILFSAPLGPVMLVLVGGFTLLFAVFGLRTLHRQFLRVAVTETEIACRGARVVILPWAEIDSVQLRYFGSRRSKWRPLGSGFMQLSLKGAGRTMTFESSLEGFDWLAGRAAQALSARGRTLDPASTSNLIELGIDPKAGPPPEHG